jgi:hypothetical protein
MQQKPVDLSKQSPHNSYLYPADAKGEGILFDPDLFHGDIVADTSEHLINLLTE